ncbi:MAG: tRNA (adenosine(37)-N6)-threonylcarbamoyltransferase complex ATPase subunit type 1 TsaE [Candidatus Peribacteria bacterium]|nr:MAG: tRNA (adenosine(37)-N6)-threonylcarbamoyltransferase complex ATPase subunit type 1 TsaE [Candidatus Peribacteria bacterium]
MDKVSVYHFDLYRLKDYDEFFAIGGEDILDNNDGIVLIEWPEIIAEHYSPDIDVYLKKTDREDEREITLQYF